MDRGLGSEQEAKGKPTSYTQLRRLGSPSDAVSSLPDLRPAPGSQSQSDPGSNHKELGKAGSPVGLPFCKTLLGGVF